jgi:hypothetical protein
MNQVGGTLAFTPEYPGGQNLVHYNVRRSLIFIPWLCFLSNASPLIYQPLIPTGNIDPMARRSHP